MLPERPKCGFRTTLVSLFGMVFISAICLVYFIGTSRHDTQKVMGVQNKLHSIESSGGNVVILLQQSQVQVQAQITRLMAIDTGWASWRTSKGSSSQVTVFAALPLESISIPSFSPANINAFPMLPVASEQSVKGSPYHQMINSLYHIISEGNYTTTKWIVMANDHTFIIPPNLQKFLNTLDAERVTYSGNELKIPYKNRVLSFASGGAGAVMSHVLVKLMLVVWVIAEQAGSHLPWERTTAGSLVTSDVFTCTIDSIVADLRGTGEPVEAVLSFLYRWRSAADAKGVENQVCGKVTSPPTTPPRGKVVLRLSSKVRVIISRTIVGGALDHSVVLLSSGSDSTPHSSQELRKECTAQNKWERTNPGIILAHCIGKVFGVNFTSSTTSEVHRPRRQQEHAAVRPLLDTPGQAAVAERFNVYGVLRSLLGDFDAWYVDAKRTTEAIVKAASGPKQTRDGADRGLDVLARDAISFHYVSETESQLLYDLLSDRSGSDKQGVRHLEPICHPPSGPRSISKSINATTADCSKARDIHALWPATDKAAGHYSRPLSKGPTSFHEAELLYEYLSAITVG